MARTKILSIGGGSAFASGGVTANVIPKATGTAGQLQDSPLLSPDANTVQQSNTTTVQAFYLYGTTDSNTSPTNYERLALTFNLAAQNRFNIAVQKGGTGTLRDIDITTNAAIGFLDSGGGRKLAFNTSTGIISNYQNVTTAGAGVSVVRAAARSTAQSAAVASVATVTAPAADSSYIVSANVNVTTATSHTFTLTCAYTDETNTARTATMTFFLVGGTSLVTAVANTNGAVPYHGIPMQIRAKGATTITIATTGTFTTVTYNVEGTIQQVN